MCRAPVQRHRARVQGPGVPPGESGLGPDAVVPGSGADRGRRRFPGRLRHDHRRVRVTGPPGHGRAPGAQPGPGPGPQRGSGPGHRRLPDLPRRRRHPRAGRPAGRHRPAEGDRFAGRPGLRLRAHLLDGRTGAQPPVGPPVTGGPGQFPPRRPPRAARHADGGLEQGVPPRVRGARGLLLPTRLLRGHPLDLPGAAGRRVRGRPGPGLRALPPAPDGVDPDHHQPPPPRHLRPVRPGLRLPHAAAPSWSAGGRPCTGGWPSTSAPCTPTRAACRARAGPSSSPGRPRCCAATGPPGARDRCRCRCRGPTGSGTP